MVKSEAGPIERAWRWAPTEFSRSLKGAALMVLCVLVWYRVVFSPTQGFSAIQDTVEEPTRQRYLLQIHRSWLKKPGRTDAGCWRLAVGRGPKTRHVKISRPLPALANNTTNPQFHPPPSASPLSSPPPLDKQPSASMIVTMPCHVLGRPSNHCSPPTDHGLWATQHSTAQLQ